MSVKRWPGFMSFREPKFSLVILIAFIFGVACYWSDWITLLKLYQVNQEGSLIKNAAKALLVGLFLGALFKDAVWAVILGLIVPSLVVRQIEISRDAPADSNLLPLVVGADILLSIFIALAILIASLAAKWFKKRSQSNVQS